MDVPAADTLREVLEKHHRTLQDELSTLLDSCAARATESERTRTLENLNQFLRQMRQAESPLAILNQLQAAARALGSTALVLRIEGDRCTDFENPEREFDPDSAPALRSVIETKDPVVTLATDAELSPALSAELAASAGAKAYLYPLTVRQKVVAVLVTTGNSDSARHELICEAAGLRLESLTGAPAAPAPGFVQIAAPDIPASETSGPRKWDDLSPEDQRLHLQAQRVARVKAAELRLNHADALRRGSFEGNIYGALRGEIDALRAEFLQNYLAKSATMVDYLHLEILRSLAHDDDRLLGKDYPGPMV